MTVLSGKVPGDGVAGVLHTLEVKVLLRAVMAEAVEGHGLPVHELDSHPSLVGMIRGRRDEPHHVGALAGDVSVYIERRHQGCESLAAMLTCFRSALWELMAQSCYLRLRPSTPDLGFAPGTGVDWNYSNICSNSCLIVFRPDGSYTWCGPGGAMGMFSESVDVVCTPAGQPLSSDWAGPPLHRLRRTGPLVRTAAMVGGGTAGAAGQRSRAGGPRDLAGPGAPRQIRPGTGQPHP